MPQRSQTLPLTPVAHRYASQYVATPMFLAAHRQESPDPHTTAQAIWTLNVRPDADSIRHNLSSYGINCIFLDDLEGKPFRYVVDMAFNALSHPRHHDVSE